MKNLDKIDYSFLSNDEKELTLRQYYERRGYTLLDRKTLEEFYEEQPYVQYEVEGYKYILFDFKKEKENIYFSNLVIKNYDNYQRNNIFIAINEHSSNYDITQGIPSFKRPIIVENFQKLSKEEFEKYIGLFNSIENKIVNICSTVEKAKMNENLFKVFLKYNKERKICDKLLTEKNLSIYNFCKDMFSVDEPLVKVIKQKEFYEKLKHNSDYFRQMHKIFDNAIFYKNINDNNNIVKILSSYKLDEKNEFDVIHFIYDKSLDTKRVCIDIDFDCYCKWLPKESMISLITKDKEVFDEVSTLSNIRLDLE